MTSTVDVASGLDRPHISLEEANEVAALQTRIDRKYLVDETTLMHLLGDLPDSARILEIGGRTEFGYRSTYFDTSDLELYRAAAHRHRRRFKVRTRTYVDAGDCYLEVKTKGCRGANVKERIAWPDLLDRRLTPTGREFVDAVSGTRSLSEQLGPVLTTSYTRSTIVDVEDTARFTIDRGLACVDAEQNVATLDSLVVETKSGGAPSAADRWLWQHHVRPQRISKYCTGLAAVRPDLSANRWHRVLDRYWNTDPAGSTR